MHFLKELDWLAKTSKNEDGEREGEEGEESQPEGAIPCPGCKQKLGSYNLSSGIECSCGFWVHQPAFQILKSRVDALVAVNSAEMIQKEIEAESLKIERMEKEQELAEKEIRQKKKLKAPAPVVREKALYFRNKDYQVKTGTRKQKASEGGSNNEDESEDDA